MLIMDSRELESQPEAGRKFDRRAFLRYSALIAAAAAVGGVSVACLDSDYDKAAEKYKGKEELTPVPIYITDEIGKLGPNTLYFEIDPIYTEPRVNFYLITDEKYRESWENTDLNSAFLGDKNKGKLGFDYSEHLYDVDVLPLRNTPIFSQTKSIGDLKVLAFSVDQTRIEGVTYKGYNDLLDMTKSEFTVFVGNRPRSYNAQLEDVIPKAVYTVAPIETRPPSQ